MGAAEPMVEALVIRPQPGPQEKFLASSADIAIYGGAAGGGKSFGLVLEPVRHKDNPLFGGAIFRRTSPQLTGPGSIWEEAQGLYRPLGADMVESPVLTVEFPAGALLQFLHLQHAKDVYDHQGKQYAYIGFDELTHFEASQFWYMVSRLRSISGVAPYMRATCNPDPDSFVAELIAWWIDQDTGYPIPERSGVLRYFVRIGDSLEWADDAASLKARFPKLEPMSLTFIAAKLEDNKILTKSDPSYLAKLLSLPEVEQARLLGGNWKIRPGAGKFIKRDYFSRRWDSLPPVHIYGASDYAVTPLQDDDAEENDPDFTEHGIFGVDANDDLYVIDWWFGQEDPDVWIDKQIALIKKHKPLCWFGEGGVIRRAVEGVTKKRMMEKSAYCRREWINHGGTQAQGSSKQGFADRSKRAKAARARAFQARAAMGKIVFPRNAPWVEHVISNCVGFPSVKKDDAFDAMSIMCNVIDEAHPALAPAASARKPAVKPFTAAWLDQDERTLSDSDKARYLS